MTKKELRPYQKKLVTDVLKTGNSIIVLPTGSGKTIIAAEIILQKRKLYSSSKSVFFVPTCILVAQQACAIREWTGMNVGEYKGGLSMPVDFDVLVSTPKAFLNAQCTNSFESHLFDAFFFDEVHHLLKDHPYNKIAMIIRKLPVAPLIVGLTASLTYAVNEKQVQKSIQRITKDLEIVSLLTIDQEDLKKGGYHGNIIQPQVSSCSINSKLPIGVLPSNERKAHLMLETFLSRMYSNSGTLTSIEIFKIVQMMQNNILTIDPDFQSPIGSLPVKDWGKYAHSRISFTSKYLEIEHWYEAIRILVVSWEEAEDAAIMFLKMNKSNINISMWPSTIQSLIQDLFDSNIVDFSRFENLKETLLEQLKIHRDFRGIIFVQQRVMTHILEYFIRNDELLSSSFTPLCLYSSTSPATSLLKITPSQSVQILEQFADGTSNLLISTVVSEEGMDIPESNCVIRFDPMLNSVSFVQGRGRARQENSDFIVLSERSDRTTETFANVEKQQLEMIRTFKPKYVKGKPSEIDLIAQKSREQSAKKFLMENIINNNNCIGILNNFCSKTKVPLKETCIQDGLDWVVSLFYQSTTMDLCASSVSVSKANAKKDASIQIISQIITNLE